MDPPSSYGVDWLRITIDDNSVSQDKSDELCLSLSYHVEGTRDE